MANRIPKLTKRTVEALKASDADAVYRNPLLAEERARKREALLNATEKKLEAIAAATRRERRRLKGAERIGERVGRVIGRYKMAKHFAWSLDDEGRFNFRRDDEAIAAEAALDGLYVVRTSLADDELDAAATVRAYKRLSTVERAFRSLKTVDLKVRPVFHHAASRVPAHVLLCMLAYYVEWHMRRQLAPLLFDDDGRDAAEAARRSVVAPAQVSETARAKGPRQAQRRGRPGAQLPHPAGRSRDHNPEHGPAALAGRHAVRGRHSAHPAAGQGLRTVGRAPLAFPVETH